MQLLSTLVFLSLAVLASSERKLLRAGYDSPIGFSTLTGGASTTTPQQLQGHSADMSTGAALPGLTGVDSLAKSLSGNAGGVAGLSKLLPSSLSSPGALSALTNGATGGKSVVPTDLSALSGGGALSSLSNGGLGAITNHLTNGGGGLDSITSGLADGGKLPSLPGLPIGGSSGVDATKGLSEITHSLSGITGGLGLPSAPKSASTGTDNTNPAYSSEAADGSAEGHKSSPSTVPTSKIDAKAESEASPAQTSDV
ncbi:Glutathionyl-hydroquinone reductase YqjG [Phytophthora cinnamomi]|uniref:Glutathionyl-hydroquinone reductase YqjG n=1 Tax=Phytophthora cinnamomi TaxID=4785 RepID=UPI00355A725B|nr:Glutathionyl-hydroquinone reductase YqjG [Phytophthora cinnamomi]